MVKRIKRSWRNAISNLFKLTNPQHSNQLGLKHEDVSEIHSFYNEKDRSVPRFAYRRLQRALSLATDTVQRAKAIDGFLSAIEAQGSKGDFLKFKWTLPNYLRQELDAAELARVDQELAQRRSKRNRRYIEVYPHCADEFSLDESFLDATLGTVGAPVIAKSTQVFTIGSCFARNIAVFLQEKGYSAEAFRLAEDINSPLSNAKMLSVATASSAAQTDYLRHWLAILNPDESAANVERLVERELARLKRLLEAIRTANFIIVTVGNTFDFFVEPDAQDIAPEIPVAPKFFKVSDSEDVDKRGAVSSHLKAHGAKFRMATFAEARKSLEILHSTIRSVNSRAHCVFTLSPVPIDSAIGVEKTVPYGAIELDCISKSTLRAALNEVFAELSAIDGKFHYFPSFEIVRWIGAMLPIPVFGLEDAASRHVSSDILNAVYGYFLRKYGVVES